MFSLHEKEEMSRLTTKPTKWYVRPAKTQISLSIRPVWSESSLCAQWVAKDPSVLHADSKDSDQTGQMHSDILCLIYPSAKINSLATRVSNCAECSIQNVECRCY